MKLLFLLPSKGGSTSMWYFLKQHPNVQTTNKKMISDQENAWPWDNYFWPSQAKNGSVYNEDTESFLNIDPYRYYSLWYFNDPKRRLCVDATDNILDKHYFKYIPSKLTKFESIFYFYTLRNPFKQLASHLLFFNLICPEYTTEFKEDINIRCVRFKKSLMKKDSMKKIADHYKTISTATRLKKIFDITTNDKILIYHLNEVIEHKKEIYEKLDISNTDNNILPHSNSTTDQYNWLLKQYQEKTEYDTSKEVKEYEELFPFVQDICNNNKYIKEVILEDCNIVKNEYGFNLLKY
jgi:hypothetical protein